MLGMEPPASRAGRSASSARTTSCGNVFSGSWRAQSAAVGDLPRWDRDVEASAPEAVAFRKLRRFVSGPPRGHESGRPRPRPPPIAGARVVAVNGAVRQAGRPTGRRRPRRTGRTPSRYRSRPEPAGSGAIGTRAANRRGPVRRPDSSGKPGAARGMRRRSGPCYPCGPVRPLVLLLSIDCPSQRAPS